MQHLVLYGAALLFGVLVLWTGAAVYVLRARSQAESPIDAETLLNTIEEPLLVLDDDSVVAANIAFRSQFTDEPAGKQTADVLEEYPDIRDAVLDGTDEVVTIESDGETRHFELQQFSENAARKRVVLFYEVTGQHEHQQQLEDKNERLDEFASLISHDLRNPLDVAIGRTNAVREMADDAELDHQLGKAIKAHRRMRRIITDVLTLAREGEEIGTLSDVALTEVTADAWDHVDTENATLDVTTEFRIRADPDRLERIFANLFRNAVEHAGDNVTITVGTIDGSSGFFVGDDGDGIPESERSEVLEAGYSQHSDGTGLGLAIVSQIAEAHGWDIRVTESDAGGARFEFTGVETVADEFAARA